MNIELTTELTTELPDHLRSVVQHFKDNPGVLRRMITELPDEPATLYHAEMVEYATARTGNAELAERLAAEAIQAAEHRGAGLYARPWLYNKIGVLCKPHDSEATMARGQSDAAVITVLDYLKATAPNRFDALFHEVCERAKSWPDPWPADELLKIAKELVEA
ncbi:hypothetical protein NA78x_000346 [Anatilimnocola sp. NA78]|uniref:hypothetical protein n=1 Tax=Anatilimnocola sp. NA78 TaxID=3415683 RepID=UPI003CE46FC2